MPLVDVNVMSDAQFNTYLTQQATQHTAIITELTAITTLLQAQEQANGDNQRAQFCMAALTGLLAGRARHNMPEDYFAAEVSKVVDSLMATETNVS